jgi:dTDP-4-amino-4,6-dideoxygalactose transaminase
MTLEVGGVLHMIPINDLTRSTDFDDEFFEALKLLIQSGQFLNGKYTRLLETGLAQFVKADFAIGVANGTAALSLAFKALELPVDSGVLLAANAGGYARIALNQNSLKPIYVDVSSSGLLDLRQVEETLNSSGHPIRAMVITHLYGQSHDLVNIRRIADTYEIQLIEDCAQSIGAQFAGKTSGSVGDLATFSFYPTKNLGGVGDSGAVATSNHQLAEKIKSLKQYGWNTKYSVELNDGDNLRIDEIQALAVYSRLKKIAEKNSKRVEIWNEFNLSVNQVGLKLIGTNSTSFVAHLGILDCGKNRESIQKYFTSQKITTDVHYPIPDHKQIVWSDESCSLPETERQSGEFLTIPLFPELSSSEIERIKEALAGLGTIL